MRNRDTSFGLSRRQLLAIASSMPVAVTLSGARAQSASTTIKGGQPIPVAVLVDDDPSLMDILVPCFVLGVGDVAKIPGFNIYLVASDTQPKQSVPPGAALTAQYTFENAPVPKILIMGAQAGRGKRKLEWIRHMHKQVDVIMSVCTGSYLLAATGLLDGKTATTHHKYYDDFQKSYPKVKVVRGPQYIDNGNIATTRGPLGSVLYTLKLVERYYGAEAARKIEDFVEFS